MPRGRSFMSRAPDGVIHLFLATGLLHGSGIAADNAAILPFAQRAQALASPGCADRLANVPSRTRKRVEGGAKASTGAPVRYPTGLPGITVISSCSRLQSLVLALANRANSGADWVTMELRVCSYCLPHCSPSSGHACQRSLLVTIGDNERSSGGWQFSIIRRRNRESRWPAASKQV